MKKILVLVLVFCFAFVLYGAEKAAPVAKKDIAAETKSVLVQADWEKAVDEAEFLQTKGDYDGASLKYLEAVKIAQQIGDKFTNSRSAWGLNDAAYEIILKHKKDSSTDLSKAKRCLEDAAKIEGVVDKECLRCIESNMSYVKDHFKEEVKEKKEVTKEVKKK